MCVQQEVWYFNYTATNDNYHHHKLSIVMEALSLLIIITVSLFANVFAIAAILKSYHGRNVHYMFILNLFVTDLGITLTTMFFSLYDIFNPGYLICFKVLCRVQNYISLVLHLSNVLAICLIAIHRFLGVVVSSKVIVRKTHAYIMLTVGWSVPAVVGVFPVSGFVSASVYTAGTHTCSPDWKDSCSFFILMIISLYGLALPTMTICYILIIREIRRSEARLRKTKENSATLENTNSVRYGSRCDSHDETPTVDSREVSVSTVSIQVAIMDDSDNEGETHEVITEEIQRRPGRQDTRTRLNMSADKKVALTCGLIVSASFACWTPYFIIHATCAWDLIPPHGLGVFAKWLVFFNTALDPVIYVAFNKRLRNSLRCTKRVKRTDENEQIVDRYLNKTNVD